MNKKYELTDKTIKTKSGKTLHRMVSVPCEILEMSRKEI